MDGFVFDDLLPADAAAELGDGVRRTADYINDRHIDRMPAVFDLRVEGGQIDIGTHPEVRLLERLVKLILFKAWPGSHVDCAH